MATALVPVLEEMLAEETFTEISVERLVQEARDRGHALSRSSFYNHFEDKGDLLTQMVEGVLSGLFQTAGESWWKLRSPVDQEQLLQALRPIAESYLPHAALIRCVVESSSYDRRTAECWSALMSQAIGYVRTHVADGQRLGFVSDEIEPEHDAEWIAWMIERGLQQLVTGATAERRELFLQALSDILWRVLYLKDV